MLLNDISPGVGSKHATKRVGRGMGSGLGKTCGRGHKGQKSRAGGKINMGFEGGQMPLQRRLPKHGFTNKFRKLRASICLRDLEKFADNTEISPELLKAEGLISWKTETVKIVASGNITKALIINGCKASKTAMEKLIGAGGSFKIAETVA